MRKIYNSIGLMSEWSARFAIWLIVALIISICYDVFMRYFFNAPTTWSYIFSYMLGACLSALGLGYVHKHGGNVRVDIVYTRFSPKVRTIIDVFFTVVFFLPLYGYLTYLFGVYTWEAFLMKRTAVESAWYPVVWPYVTAVTLGFAILVLQGAAIFMRNVMTLAKGGKEPW